jgi:hypothetical protein
MLTTRTLGTLTPFMATCLLRLAPVAVALLSVPALPASTAFAQSDSDRATARALGQEGEAALEAKDYAKAEDRFRRADKLIHAPTLELGLARALVGVGKLVEAQETYNRIVREGVPPGAPPAFAKALESAKNEVGAVSPRLGTVTITVKGAGGAEVPDASVTLDGVALNTASLGVRRFIDPGAHVLHASGTGFKAGELRFNVTEGQTTDAPLSLEVAPQAAGAAGTAAAGTAPGGATAGPGGEAQPGGETGAPHKGPGILPWVAFGIGGAGLILGGVTGGLALGAHSTLAGECPATNCPSSAQNDLNSYHAYATLSTVGFIVGGVGAVAGVVLLLTAPKGESPPPAQAGLRVVPVLGPGSIGAVGQF